MIVIAGAVIGAILGWITATRRNGTTPDKAQYAAGYGIAFGICGLFLTIIIAHLAG